MESKYRRFYLDWFNIRKRTVYKVVTTIVFLAGVAGGGYWVWKSNILTVPIENNSGPRDSARVLTYQGDVRIIRVSTRKTERVSEGLTVQAGDTIQTQSDGRCQILMIDGSTLSIRPNSTVVIRDSSSLFGGTSVRVKLDDGQIRVRTEDQPENTKNVVEVKETENRLASQTDASFNLDQQGNRGEIRVTRGNIESSTNGVRTTLRQDEYAAVNNGQVASRERLLRPPVPDQPPPSAQVPTPGSAKTVEFSWRRSFSAGDLTYDFQLAASPFFVENQMIKDEARVRGLSLNVAGLLPDNYYWRVRAVSGSGQKSEWSEPSRLTIYLKRGTTRIEAGGWKVEHLGGRIYQVSGRTEPGVTVRILGREIYSSYDGTFILQISTSSSTVGVTLTDDKGNRGQYNLSLRTGRASG